MLDGLAIVLNYPARHHQRRRVASEGSVEDKCVGWDACRLHLVHELAARAAHGGTHACDVALPAEPRRPRRTACLDLIEQQAVLSRNLTHYFLRCHCDRKPG